MRSSDDQARTTICRTASWPTPKTPVPLARAARRAPGSQTSAPGGMAARLGVLLRACAGTAAQVVEWVRASWLRGGRPLFRTRYELRRFPLVSSEVDLRRV